MNSCAQVKPDFLHPISLLSFSPTSLDFLPSINALFQPTNKTFCRHFPESIWHLSGNNEVGGTCFRLVPQLPADNTWGTCWGFLDVGERLRLQTPAELSHPLSPPSSCSLMSGGCLASAHCLTQKTNAGKLSGLSNHHSPSSISKQGTSALVTEIPHKATLRGHRDIIRDVSQSRK